jgi:hypothetical protein
MASNFKIEKGLIVDHPWIDKILDGTKTWEMRSRSAPCHNLFGLIAKGSGAVQGVARITEIGTPLTQAEMIESFPYHQIPKYMILSGQASKWKIPWKLANVRRLHKPVPYLVKSGPVVWVNLDREASMAIEKQLSDWQV